MARGKKAEKREETRASEDPIEAVPFALEAEVAAMGERTGIRPGVLLWDRKTREAQRLAVEGLIIEGVKLRQIYRLMVERWPEITLKTVKRRIDQANEERRREETRTVAELRMDSIERLHGIRRKAMEAEDWKTAVAAEKEIAKLAGLYEPRASRIDVNHSMAMGATIASLDPELASRLLDEAREERALAAKARALLPAAVIDVEVVPAGRPSGG